MKTLYWDGRIDSDAFVLDVNYKKSKVIGYAHVINVFRAKLEGDVRVFQVIEGRNVGVSASEWQKFMDLHYDKDIVELLAAKAINIWDLLKKPRDFD